MLWYGHDGAIFRLSWAVIKSNPAVGNPSDNHHQPQNESKSLYPIHKKHLTLLAVSGKISVTGKGLCVSFIFYLHNVADIAMR